MTELTKICKKHGQLDSNQIRVIYNKKYQKEYLVCLLCIKIYTEEWKKRNPGKAALSQKNYREKRLEQLNNNTLTMNCKNHGIIPKEKIRIDSRGTIICKLCDAETHAKVRKKDKNLYLKRCKEWRIKNPDKIKKYTQNYKERRKLLAPTQYKRRMKDPVIKEKIRQYRIKSSKKSIEELSDGYIKGLIRTIRKGGKNNRSYEYLQGAEIPKEIIELKKLQIKLNRTLRKQRKANNGN